MPGKPRKNTIESLVKWMMERGSSILEILARATDKYPFGRLDKIGQYYAKWVEATGRGIHVGENPVIPDAARRDLRLYGEAPGFERKTVDITWLNPKTGALEDRTYGIDIPSGLRGKAKDKAVAARLLHILNSQYENAIKTESDLLKFIITYKVRGRDD